MISDYDQVMRANTQLKSKRLKLRPFTSGDVADVYAYAKDPVVTQYLTWAPHTSIEQSTEVLSMFFIDRPGVFAIELLEEQVCIGCIELRLDFKHDKASFGYVLNQDYWNQGYMTEALGLVLDLAFKQLQVNRVEATHYVGNEASGRVMQKVGMKYEGLGRQEVKIKGVYYDVIHYAVLRSEWQQEYIKR